MDADQTTEAVHRLLTTANLHRMRGNVSEATNACRQVLELAPANATAHDLLGDLLLGQGKLEEAMQHFRQAFEIEPRPATEEKIARLVLRLNEAKWAAPAGGDAVAPPNRKLSPSMACAMSVLFPGLGQIYNGERTKGMALFAAGVVFLISTTLLLAPNLMAIRAALTGGARHGASAPPISGMLWVMMFILAGVWIYSIVDASLSATAQNQGGRSPREKSGWEV